MLFDSGLKLLSLMSGPDQLLDKVVDHSLEVDVAVDGLHTSLDGDTSVIGEGSHDGSINAGTNVSCRIIM